MSDEDRKKALAECMDVPFEAIDKYYDRENLYSCRDVCYLVLTNEEADAFFEDEYIGDPLTDKIQLLPEFVRSAEYPADNWRSYARDAGRSFFLGDDGVEFMCRISDVAYYVYRVRKVDSRDYGFLSADSRYVIRHKLYKYNDDGTRMSMLWDCKLCLDGWRMSLIDAKKDYLRARELAEDRMCRIIQTLRGLQDFGEFTFSIDTSSQKVGVEVKQAAFTFRKSID